MPSTANTAPRTVSVHGTVSGSATRYDVIEALRFFAAALVVLVHLPTLEWAAGAIGVDIFFVISGFVMMASTDRSGENFFLKRVIRIVPLYWFFTFCVFGVSMIAPELLENTRPIMSDLLRSLAFIPFGKNESGRHLPVLYLGWTLNYEMYFYALFAIALSVSHRWRGVIAATLVTASLVVCYHLDSFIAWVYSNTIVMEFVMGMLLYELLGDSRYSIKDRQPHILIYLLLLVTPFIFGTLNDVDRGYGWGPIAFLIVMASVYLFRDKRLPNIFLTLGAASYALYLSHPYLLTFFDKVMNLYGHGFLANTASSLLSFVLVTLTGMAVFRWFETPITRALRKRFVDDSRH